MIVPFKLAKLNDVVTDFKHWVRSVYQALGKMATNGEALSRLDQSIQQDRNGCMDLYSIPWLKIHLALGHNEGRTVRRRND